MHLITLFAYAKIFVSIVSVGALPFFIYQQVMYSRSKFKARHKPLIQTTSYPIISTMLFVIPVLLALAINSAQKILAFQEIELFVKNSGPDISVIVEDKIIENKDLIQNLFNELQQINQDHHHSHPTIRTPVVFSSSAGKLHLLLRKDSDVVNEYWVYFFADGFSEFKGGWSDLELGKLVSPELSEFLNQQE